MANTSAIDGLVLQQMMEFIRQLSQGVLPAEIAPPAEAGQEVAEIFDFLNTNVANLLQLGAFFKQFKSEITQLVEGTQDVLGTIEKATIRVLDNTDGILEQHDIIEKNNELLKQNPVLLKIFGPRLEKFGQAQSKGRMFVFDIIQAQEFQELTKKQTEKLLGVLEEMKKQLMNVQTVFQLRDQPHTNANQELTAEEAPVEVPKKANQDLVDQLLAEFGL